MSLSMADPFLGAPGRLAGPGSLQFKVRASGATFVPEWCAPGACRGCDCLRRWGTRLRSVLVVVIGRGSIGKTHMASALCALACERRLEARFFTASSLVMRLRRAREDGRLDREAALIGKARLLVIDELGFLPLDATGRGCSSRSSPTHTRGRRW